MSAEEKNRKIKIIESMLDEVGMTKQELIDIFVSVKQEQSEENDISVTELSNADITELLNSSDSNLEKYFSLDELKKLELKVSFAFNLKRAIDLGLVVDTAKLAQILGLQGVNLTLKNGGKIEINGVEKVVSAKKAEATINYFHGLTGQQQTQGQGQSQSKNQNTPQSQNFLSRLVGSLTQQAQTALSSVLGGSGSGQQSDASAVTNRLQSQVRAVESANRQLRRQNERIRGRLGEVQNVSRRGRDSFVTVRVRTKEGKIEVKEFNLKDFSKAKNVPQGEAEKLVSDLEKAQKEQNNAIENFNQKSSEAKIIGVSYDDRGKMQYEVLIKGEVKKIPAENLAVEIKKEGYVNNEGKNKGYEVSSELKIYEQVGSTKEKSSGLEKAEKREKNENLKSDLHKLDAMSDREKLRQEQKENQKEGIKNELGSDRPEATKKASDIAEEAKDPSLKYIVQATNKQVEPDPKEKKEVKESIKTDDTLKKLDALADKQKLMESLKEVQSTLKTSVHDKMDEAMKNKDLLKDMEKERLKNPEIGPKK